MNGPEVIAERTSDGKSIRVTLVLQTTYGAMALPPSEELVRQVQEAVTAIVAAA